MDGDKEIMSIIRMAIVRIDGQNLCSDCWPRYKKEFPDSIASKIAPRLSCDWCFKGKWIKEGDVPPHEHQWEWEDDGAEHEAVVVGVICEFNWLIPPGPRGKKPRVRICAKRMSMDDILKKLNVR